MKKHNLFIILILFLLIFNPSFTGINILHFVAAFSWLYILVNMKAVSKYINMRKCVLIYAILTLICLYITALVLINNNPIANIGPFLFWMIDIIPACSMVTISLKKHGQGLEDLLVLLLWAGTIQAIFAAFAFFIPSVKELFVNSMASEEYLDIYNYMAQFRLYGFASGLTFATPVVESFLTVIALYLAFCKGFKYIFFVPLLVFAGVINARTSLIVIAIGVIIFALQGCRLNFKHIVKNICVIVCVVALVIGGISLIKQYASLTYEWIETGFDETANFLTKGDATGDYFSYMVSDTRHDLPGGPRIIIGYGARVQGSYKYSNPTDIGYINDIWLGGILYCTVIYILFARFIWKINHTVTSDWETKRFYRYLTWLFAGCFVALNVKTYVLSLNGFSTLFFIIYIFSVCTKRSETVQRVTSGGTVE